MRKEQDKGRAIKTKDKGQSEQLAALPSPGELGIQ
jgi:hypothetical protein